MARRRRHFIKRAIDAITDFELVLERLEVDVARPVLDRLIENQIDEANDRRGVGFHLGVAAGCLLACERHQLAGFAELLEDVLHAGGVLAVMFVQAVFDLQAGREHDFYVTAKGEAQIFDRLGIQRINERDANDRARLTDRQGAV